jgi:hypothetical protein
MAADDKFTTPDEYDKHYLEQQKVVLDYIKHLTALATGTILLMATLLEKLFKDAHYLKGTIPFTYGALSLSVFALTIACLCIVRSIRAPKAITQFLGATTAVSFIVGLGTFVTGMSLLAIFAISNWS